jgi:hypothetical protein
MRTHICYVILVHTTLHTDGEHEQIHYLLCVLILCMRTHICYVILVHTTLHTDGEHEHLQARALEVAWRKGDSAKGESVGA